MAFQYHFIGNYTKMQIGCCSNVAMSRYHNNASWSALEFWPSKPAGRLGY